MLEQLLSYPWLQSTSPLQLLQAPSTRKEASMSQDSNRRQPQRPRGAAPTSNSRGASSAEQPARRSQATPMETSSDAETRSGVGQRPRTGSAGRVAAPHRRAGRMMAERRRRQRIAWLLGGSSLVIIV